MCTTGSFPGTQRPGREADQSNLVPRLRMSRAISPIPLHALTECMQITLLLFLNNQPDALIIQIYSVIKFYMFRASSPPIIRIFLLYIRHWYVSCRFLMAVSKHSQDVPSWLCLEMAIKNLHETYQCRICSRKLLMMGREDARNM